MKRYELLKQTINNHGYCSVDKQNMDMIEKEIRVNERAELLDKVMQKRRTIIDEDGMMYKVVLFKDVEDLKNEVSE